MIWKFGILASLWAGQCFAFANGELGHTEYINGSGYSAGYCGDGPGSSFCYDQIKRQARDNAAREATYSCSARQGRLDSFSASCSDFCNPFQPPPNSLNTYVTCNTSCSFRCEIPDQQELMDAPEVND